MSSPVSTGLSPRIRGNLFRFVVYIGRQGSIPANTGEPWCLLRLQRQAGVYPREYGGTQHTLPKRHYRTRSIPANTGEPRRDPRHPRRNRVYPREYGGTLEFRGLGMPTAGLSPRIRGNLRAFGQERLNGGSIPANTGEPSEESSSVSVSWVYPREYGGTLDRRWWCLRFVGLSPRIRGNRLRAAVLVVLDGSIPANTGEPRHSSNRYMQYRVYPREYGGTPLVGEPPCLARGLSPRIRGNPKGRCSDALHARVYPREYGGTEVVVANFGHQGGLSPRIRGNRRRIELAKHLVGSIPANTGEPRADLWARGSRWVYPREYGGTVFPVLVLEIHAGLSPRIRGNL